MVTITFIIINNILSPIHVYVLLHSIADNSMIKSFGGTDPDDLPWSQVVGKVRNIERMFQCFTLFVSASSSRMHVRCKLFLA